MVGLDLAAASCAGDEPVLREDRFFVSVFDGMVREVILDLLVKASQGARALKQRNR